MYKNIQFICVISFFNLLQPVFGQSLQDLQKMKSEYEKLQKNQNQASLSNQNLEDGSSNIQTPFRTNIFPYQYQSPEDSTDQGLKHFGYDFFTKRDTIPFWENLPTPPNYLLGPGDELVLSLWGETQLRNKYIIDRDGNIYDEKVGILNLMGKTIENANLYLRNQFSRVYSTLNKPRPSTYLNLSIGRLRSINVSFVGNVNYPGIHPIHPFSDVVNGLIQAGGVDTTGSLRNILIKRNNKIVERVDFYDFLTSGELSSKAQLRDKDIIIIPNRLSTITIDSSIMRPGYYEAKIDDNIGQLVDYAGGLKHTASSVISIQRVVPINKNKFSGKTTQNIYVNYSMNKKEKVENGDVIMPLSILPTISKVEIIGQVKRPGFYNYYNGMKLIDLVELGGGLNDSTYIKSIFMESAEIVRRDPDTKFEKIVKVNLNNIYKDDGPGQIKLHNLDRFVVRSNYNYFKKQNINISGEVTIPGSYPLLSDRESLKSIISRSGGLTKNALKDGISIYRDKNYISKFNIEEKEKNKIFKLQDYVNEEKEKEKSNSEWIRVAWQNDDVIIMPGDSIVIKRSPGTINVSGEVYNPGLIEFQKGKPLRYYVDSAGGPTNDGDKNNVIVIYANGVIKPKKLLNNPRIRDGATIIVNQKKNEDKINYMELATSTLSIISTTVTVLVLSQQLSTN